MTSDAVPPSLSHCSAASRSELCRHRQRLPLERSAAAVAADVVAAVLTPLSPLTSPQSPTLQPTSSHLACLITTHPLLLLTP